MVSQFFCISDDVFLLCSPSEQGSQGMGKKFGEDHNLVLIEEGVVGQTLVPQQHLSRDVGSPKLADGLGLAQVQEEREEEWEQHHPDWREGLDWLEELECSTYIGGQIYGNIN